MRDDIVHALEIRREKQKGGERGRADGVALSERLGRVARGVQLVRLLADVVRLVGHLDNAAGVVGDGPEGVHGQDVGRGGKHAHGGDGGAVDALRIVGDIGPFQTAHAEVVAQEQRQTDHDDRHGGCLHADGESADDVGGRAGERGFGDGADGAVAGFGVVLGNADEKKRHQDADDAATKQPPASLEHEVDGRCKADQRE